MAHQTSVNGGLRFRHPEGILSSLGDFGGDFATLAELQAKLALVDAKEAAGKASTPTAVLVVSSAILLGTVPVVLIGLAFLLATWLGSSQGLALLITGLVVAVVAGAVAGFCAVKFLKSFESFRRSREEFTRNVAWIQTVLKQSSRSAHH